MTANGTVETNEEATVYIKELGLILVCLAGGRYSGSAAIGNVVGNDGRLLLLKDRKTAPTKYGFTYECRSENQPDISQLQRMQEETPCQICFNHSQNA